MKIAWIGTGVMGQSMAGHLLEAGHQLYVYNRTPAKAQDLVDRGAQLLDSVSQAPLKADMVFSMVGYPQDVEAVYLGPEGLIQTARPGQVFVDMTTSSPSLAQKISQAFAQLGAQALDLPVTGGDIGARNASLTIMAGGDQETFEKQVLPLVQLLGQQITYFGPAGQGQYAKLANQIAIASSMISVAESLKFAKEVGLELESFLKTVSSGSGASFSMSSYGPRILQGDYQPGFYTHHFIKDMKLALEECRRMKLELPGLELAYQLYESLSREIKETEGTQALAKVYGI